MPDDDIRRMLEHYYASWRTGDPDKVAAFFTDDAVFEDLAFGARFEGPEGVRQFVQITFAGVPDFRVTPTEIIMSTERAAAAWTMTGTLSGDLPGMPATNRPFEIRASSIIQLRDAKIHRIVDYWNPLSAVDAG